MVRQRRLILWFTLGWALCATLSILALRTSLAIGSIRMSNVSSGWQLARMQAAPWIAVALLTPVVMALSGRLRSGQLSWPAYAAAHLAALVLFGAAYVALSIELGLVLSGASDYGLSGRTMLSRAASSAVLITTKYAVIVAGTEASRFRQDARLRAEERDRLSRQALQLERDLTAARLGALRQQLQPHFLFNALNAASALIDESPAVARELIARLSDLLRLSLSRGDAPLVTFGEELDFTDRYLAVERARFGDRLQIEYDVDGQALGALVPAFVLQPLVENAIRHGFARLPGGGRIAVGAERSGGRLAFWVRNDRPAGAAIGPEGVGLTQVRARLAALYPGGATLVARTPDSATFEARLDLPAGVEALS